MCNTNQTMNNDSRWISNSTTDLEPTTPFLPIDLITLHISNNQILIPPIIIMETKNNLSPEISNHPTLPYATMQIPKHLSQASNGAYQVLPMRVRGIMMNMEEVWATFNVFCRLGYDCTNCYNIVDTAMVAIVYDGDKKSPAKMAGICPFRHHEQVATRDELSESTGLGSAEAQHNIKTQARDESPVTQCKSKLKLWAESVFLSEAEIKALGLSIAQDSGPMTSDIQASHEMLMKVIYLDLPLSQLRNPKVVVDLAIPNIDYIALLLNEQTVPTTLDILGLMPSQIIEDANPISGFQGLHDAIDEGNQNGDDKLMIIIGLDKVGVEIEVPYGSCSSPVNQNCSGGTDRKTLMGMNSASQLELTLLIPSTIEEHNKVSITNTQFYSNLLIATYSYNYSYCKFFYYTILLSYTHKFLLLYALYLFLFTEIPISHRCNTNSHINHNPTDTTNTQSHSLIHAYSSPSHYTYFCSPLSHSYIFSSTRIHFTPAIEYWMLFALDVLFLQLMFTEWMLNSYYLIHCLQCLLAAYWIWFHCHDWMKMNVFSWNCQGCGNDHTKRSLLSYIIDHNPDIIFLSEIKASPDNIRDLMQHTSYPNSHLVEPLHMAGGLLLLWKSSIDLHIKFSNKYIINVEINLQDLHVAISISFFYGSPYPQLKTTSWELLKLAAETTSLPWMVMGDLNIILSEQEKCGGTPFDRNEYNFASNSINDLGLIDLGFVGNPFTWCNKRGGTHNVRKRLDRVLVNHMWKLAFPIAELHHLPAFSSDHCPILLLTSPTHEHNPKPFKFQSMWTLDENYKNIVHMSWQRVNCPPDEKSISLHLSSTKKALKTWNHRIFGNIHAKKALLKNKISKLQAGQFSIHTKDQEKILLEELDNIMKMEELMWKQKSSDTIIKEGDKNTRYFHISTLIRRSNNRIHSILDVNNQMIHKNCEIAQVFVTHFTFLLTPVQTTLTNDQKQIIKDLFPPCITQDAKDYMLREITHEDIFHIVSNMGSLKAPGPDGFPALFYQKSWDTVQKEFYDLLHNFWELDSSIEHINHTNLALIPKIDAPQRPSDFRPISLCNVTYKVISKLLAERVKELLPQIISPLQCAFVPNRQISDNIILTHEIIHTMKKKQGLGALMALKIDMSKAFDRVNWNCLIEIMSSLGFPNKVTHLIHKCISTLHSSVLINGTPHGHFQPTAGLRQGDPISPSLFILCMEILSRMIEAKCAQNKIHGIKASRTCPPISHLLFADDLFIFCRANPSEAQEVIHTLQQFGSISGQQINFSKSGVLFSNNISPQLKAHLLNILQMSPIKKEDLYLGTPLFLGHKKSTLFHNLTSRVQNRLAGWKSKVLSQAGRTILINSVTSAIPSYQMTCFKIPKIIVQKINKLQRDFWWGTKENNKRTMHFKNWNSICQPKSKGGIGIKDLGHQNDALLSRIAWRINENQGNLCSQILKQKYFKDKIFLSSHNSKSSSWIWHSIASVIPHIKNNTCWDIGDGSTINFRKEPWVPSLPGFHTTTLSNPSHDHITHVNQLIIPNTTIWDTSLINQLFPTHVSNFIRNTHIRGTNAHDKLRWMGTKNSKFSVKSMYKFLTSQHDNHHHSHKVNTKLWKTKALPRANLFAWKCLNLVVPTREAIGRHIPIPSKACPLCDAPLETVKHMLMECPYTQAVWFASKTNFRLTHFVNMPLLDWIKSWYYPPKDWLIPPEFWATFCVTATWILWKTRCQKIFQNKRFSVMAIAKQIDYAVDRQFNPQQLQICEQEYINAKLVPPSIWIPPKTGFCKINVDIAFSNAANCIGIGYIVRNALGAFIIAGTESEHAGSAEEGECRGILQAARAGIKQRLKLVEIETDNKTAANFLNGQNVNLSWTSTNILQEVLILCNNFYDCCNFLFTPRSGNHTAHILAASRDKSYLVPTSFDVPPIWLEHQLNLDHLFCNFGD